MMFAFGKMSDFSPQLTSLCSCSECTFCALETCFFLNFFYKTDASCIGFIIINIIIQMVFAPFCKLRKNREKVTPLFGQ